MKIIYLEKVNSTQEYLKKYQKSNENLSNICFYTDNQTLGQGSRNNLWEGEKGNLFFSFSILLKNLPTDLPMQSVSIYFAYILKSVLCDMDSKLILKWPNDFYINNNKIGGLITNKLNNNLICGIGLNLIKTRTFFGHLDININKEELLKQYFSKLEIYPTWKQVFSKYKLEFHHNKVFSTNVNNEKISLEHAILNNDGSLIINNKKVYSLR